MENVRIEFSAQLTVLYIVHIVISIIASILLMIVLLMFHRFEIFHSNLRTLLWHTLLCILVNLHLQMLRILIPILQQFMGYAEDNGGNVQHLQQQTENCVMPFNEIPALICAFICVSGFMICMERLYATLRYVKYENESFEPVLTQIFILMWILFALVSVWQFVSGITSGILPNNTYFQCQIHFLHVNSLKTHWHILFAFLFYIVFCAVLYVILALNRKKKEEYIEFYYSSLSHRFQIGENLKTVLLLNKIFPLICIMFAIILGFKTALWLYLREAKTNFDRQILWNELSILIVPMFSLAIALSIIRSSTLYTTKCRLIARELVNRFWPAAFWRSKTETDGMTTLMGHYCMYCGKLHNKNDATMCEGDLLREYWDDYLHIQ